MYLFYLSFYFWKYKMEYIFPWKGDKADRILIMNVDSSLDINEYYLWNISFCGENYLIFFSEDMKTFSYSLFVQIIPVGHPRATMQLPALTKPILSVVCVQQASLERIACNVCISSNLNEKKNQINKNVVLVIGSKLRNSFNPLIDRKGNIWQQQNDANTGV